MDPFKSNYRHNIRGSLMGAFVLAAASYLATYLKYLGASDYHYAMLNALPSMVAVAALVPGAMIIDSTKNKLRTVTIICFLSRSFFLLYTLIPLLPPMLQPFALVFLMGIRNAPESVWLIGYQSLVADVFPKEKLNEIIGLRNKYNSLLTVVATFILGTFLSLSDKFPVSNLVLFQILFVFTFVVGIFEVLQYRKLAFTQATPMPSESLGKKLMAAIKSLPQHKDYVKYCLIVLVFYFGWQMAWPLYSIYQLNVLGANAQWVGYINIVSMASQVLTTTMWIKLARKIGNRPVLGITMALMAATPCLYALSTNLPMLTAMQVVAGAGISGVTFLLFNELLAVCPDTNRTLYISLFTCLTQITSSFVPFLGTFIKQIWSIDAALYISGAIRIIGAVILLYSCSKRKQKDK